MRTNIDIDDTLLAQAMKFSGLATKKATVEAALRDYVEDALRREALEAMRGMGWEGDLDAMRTDWGDDAWEEPSQAAEQSESGRPAEAAE